MPKTDITTETKTALSEKISLGFMVATGVVVIVSFLAAVSFIGINKFSGSSAPAAVVTAPTVTETEDTDTTEVLGENEDRTFSTEQ